MALNLSTLESSLSLGEGLAAAAAAGFRLVELRAPKLGPGFAEAVRGSGLEAWTVNSLEGAGDRDLGEEARRLASQAAEVGCPYVVCVPGRKREGLAEALRRLAEACQGEGAALAFEFMGFEWSAARTLREAMDAYGGPLVIDTFHWVLGGSRLADLEALEPGRLAVVHVNDAPSRDVAALGDRDRVLPGAGVLDLDPFYTGLATIGYNGVYSLELFSPVSAAAAFAAMERLIS